MSLSADHAHAIAQSCSDLVGVNLNGLTTGTASGEVIPASDCQQVAKVALAIELKSAPAQCAFQPLLPQSPPAACTTGTATTIAADGFDGGKSGSLRWQVSHVASDAGFVSRDWGVSRPCRAAARATRCSRSTTPAAPARPVATRPA